MMLSALVSLAIAGEIRIHSATPVSYKLDGQWVGRMVTELALTDVPPGAHAIEVVDPLGNVLASTNVVLVEEEPLVFDYLERRLFPKDVSVNRGPVGKALSDAQFVWVEHRLARKRKDDKRLKRLGEVVTVYWFEMRHVDTLLQGFQGLEARVTAARLLAPRTVDPQKTKAIEDHFPPGSFRDRALAAFGTYQ
jgi:hypothetical protein